MNKRRVKPNWFRIILLILLVVGATYVNEVIIPTQPQYGVPSPTITRSPESFVSEAEDYFNQGKLLQSIGAYKQAIIVRPDDPTTHIALAKVQVWAGQYEDAQTSAEDALLLNNNNAMAYAVLAWAQDFQGDYLAATTNIQRSLELDPQNAIAYAYYTEILLDSDGDIETAIEASRKAIELGPDKIETHRARGLIFEAVGDYQEAITEYQAAIAINDKIPNLYLSLGINYRILEYYPEAETAFTTANALNPQDPTPDLYLSRMYATLGQFGKARQYAETAVTDSPADTNLRGNYGVMLYRDAYWNESVKELAYVVNGGVTENGDQLRPMDLAPGLPRIAEYYFTYGLVLSRLNQCGDALRIAQLIQSRIPADELAMDNANQIVQRSQQSLDSPPPTDTEPAPVSTNVPTLEVTPTP